LHTSFLYLCVVNKEMIFTPWAARKIFLAGEEYFPRENVKEALKRQVRIMIKRFNI